MYKNILLAVDLAHDESWIRSVPTAVEYAKAFGATLHVATIVPDFGMSIVATHFPADFEEKALEESSRQLHAFTKKHIPSDIKVQHIVGCGTAYEEILRISEETKCDLIVLGAHRPEMKDYLIGTNSARIVRHANCSVLVVRD